MIIITLKIHTGSTGVFIYLYFLYLCKCHCIDKNMYVDFTNPQNSLVGCWFVITVCVILLFLCIPSTQNSYHLFLNQIKLLLTVAVLYTLFNLCMFLLLLCAPPTHPPFTFCLLHWQSENSWWYLGGVKVWFSYM